MYFWKKTSLMTSQGDDKVSPLYSIIYCAQLDTTLTNRNQNWFTCEVWYRSKFFKVKDEITRSGGQKLWQILASMQSLIALSLNCWSIFTDVTVSCLGGPCDTQWFALVVITLRETLNQGSIQPMRNIWILLNQKAVYTLLKTYKTYLRTPTLDQAWPGEAI